MIFRFLQEQLQNKDQQSWVMTHVYMKKIKIQIADQNKDYWSKQQELNDFLIPAQDFIRISAHNPNSIEQHQN